VSGLVGLDDAGRDAAPVADGVTVLSGPVTNGTGLLATVSSAERFSSRSSLRMT
jgi:hypothetical protein